MGAASVSGLSRRRCSPSGLNTVVEFSPRRAMEQGRRYSPNRHTTLYIAFPSPDRYRRRLLQSQQALDAGCMICSRARTEHAGPDHHQRDGGFALEVH